MITFKKISTSPLDPYERGTVAKYKTFSKLEDDFRKLRQVAGPNIFEIKSIKENIEKEPYYIDFWCVIPSEPFPRILDYDVIVRFYFSDNKNRIITPDSSVQVFSNSPSFMFTYAYVYNKNKATIPELNKFLSPRSLSDAPNTTNPKQLIGFEKSLFFAFLLLRESGVFQDTENYILRNRTKVGKFKVMNPVSSEQKLNQYNVVKKKEANLYNEYKKRNSFGFF